MVYSVGLVVLIGCNDRSDVSLVTAEPFGGGCLLVVPIHSNPPPLFLLNPKAIFISITC